MKIFLVLLLVLVLFAVQVYAAPLDSSGLLDTILQKFYDTSSYWQGKIVSYASWLFWTMALLSMVWTFGMLALKNAGISEALAEIIRFLAVTGFFWWLLINGPAISTSIIKSMQQIAAEASGLNNDLSPSGIIDIGFDIVSKVIDQSSIWSPINSAIGIVVASIILVVLALIGVNMLLLLISGWMLAYSGIFLLGFGGGYWTSGIAISFYKTVLGVAVQIFAMILIVGIGKSFIDQYYATLQTGNVALKELFVMLVASIVLLMLVNKVPPMLADIVGNGGSNIGTGNFGASSAFSAAGTAAAVATTASGAAAAGATSMAGGVSALKAAFQQSQQHMAEGSGTFSNNSGGSGSGGGSGGFMSTMGTASRFAADMSKNLARGIGGVAQDKAANIMDTAKEEVGQTMGGQVASEISKPGSAAQARQNRQDLTAAEELREEMRTQEARDFLAENLQQDSFTGDSLGAGQENTPSVPINEEVADFVNKSNQNQLNLKEHRHK